MQRKEAVEEQNLDKKIQELLLSQKTKSRISSLAPYLAQIERRKKIKELAKQSKNNLHRSSSKSFRIKQKSVTSLQKEALVKTRDTSNGVISKLLEQRAHREQRAKSFQSHHHLQYSKTLQNKSKQSSLPQDNTFFDDLNAKAKNKAQKEGPLRRKKYETIEAPRSRSSQAREPIMKSIGSTKAAYTLVCNQEDRKKNQKARKNLRRNKFEVESQPTLKIEYFQESKERLTKKESNVSINRQMDRLAQRQMECFYKQIRNKEIHRSVQHTTQQYFNSDSYRPVKSKNDIEVFLSTAKTPALQKISQSAEDKSRSKVYPKHQSSLLYDFSFPEEFPFGQDHNESSRM